MNARDVRMTSASPSAFLIEKRIMARCETSVDDNTVDNVLFIPMQLAQLQQGGLLLPGPSRIWIPAY